MIAKTIMIPSLLFVPPLLVTTALTSLILCISFNQKHNYQISTVTALSPQLTYRITNAIKLSKKCNDAFSSPSIAREASKEWDEILNPRKIPYSGFTSQSNKNDDLLQHQSDIPQNIQAICHVMHGHVLCRCGRDNIATLAYRRSLHILNTNNSIENKNNPELEMEARLGLGKCYQRLMKYSEGRDEFYRVATSLTDLGNAKISKGAICSAVTCSMRIGDINWAKNVLSRYINNKAEKARSDEDDSDEDKEYMGLLGAILLMEYNMIKEERLSDDILRTETSLDDFSLKKKDLLQRIIDLLGKASISCTTSPLYRWLYHVALREEDTHKNMLLTKSSLPIPSMIKVEERKDSRSFYTYNDFCKLSSINNSPFDMPQLVILDNKIWLHDLMSVLHKNSQIKFATPGSMSPLYPFWPSGFVMPAEFSDLRDSIINKRKKSTGDYGLKQWILKEPTAYGSNGNSIVSEDFILSLSDSTAPENILGNEELLCQSMVHPPVLLTVPSNEMKTEINSDNGHKFSLRVYVLLLPPSSPHQDKQHKDACSKNSGNRLSNTFISREGLVKLAPLPFNNMSPSSSKGNVGVHVTNSAQQCHEDKDDLQGNFFFLRNELSSRGYNYDEIWDNIRSIVGDVILASPVNFVNGNVSNWRPDVWEKLPSSTPIMTQHYLHMPKILGFDFLLKDVEVKVGNAGLENKDIVTGKRLCRPYLIEVNRFPGLEPRNDFYSSVEATVKRAVVEDSWIIASKQIGLDCGDVLGITEQTEQSLEQSSIHTLNYVCSSHGTCFEPL